MTLTPKQIKKLRESLCLTQEAMASKLGVSFVTVSRWENGKVTPSPLACNALKILGKEKAAS